MDPFVFFRPSPIRRVADSLYRLIVAQARQPVFYAELGVADSAIGRFDLLVVHLFFVMRRLNALGKPGNSVAQALLAAMFDDMDNSLRELGVGDLSVGRTVKNLAERFYGRVAAYEAGLTELTASNSATGPAEGTEALGAALGRNLYAGSVPGPAIMARMLNYFAAAAAAIEAIAADDILSGTARFPSPPA